MTETLGILVTSDEHPNYVIELVTAAHKKGKDIHVFFTGKGAVLTRLAEIVALMGKARLSVCERSFRFNELKDKVPGKVFMDFDTQARNTEIMEKCDRYLVF